MGKAEGAKEAYRVEKENIKGDVLNDIFKADL